MSDIKKQLLELTPNKIFSIDTRGKPMTQNTFYNQISKNMKLGNNLVKVATIGFFKAGQLLNKAKDELGRDFGKLKKKLARDGLHEKQQERYMKIAKNKNIDSYYGKLPPQWTFWDKISDLSDEKFNQINHLIHQKAKWNEIALYLGNKKNDPSGNTHANKNDNRSEIFGLEYDDKYIGKKYKSSFEQFTSELHKLSKKYVFIKLKQKNYFKDAYEFMTSDKVKDDTSKKTSSSKFKRSYSSKKKSTIL